MKYAITGELESAGLSQRRDRSGRSGKLTRDRKYCRWPTDGFIANHISLFSFPQGLISSDVVAAEMTNDTVIPAKTRA
jgi:hypothetical protein